MKNLDSASPNSNRSFPKRSPKINSAHLPFKPRSEINSTDPAQLKKPSKTLKWIFFICLIIITALSFIIFSRASNLTNKIFDGQSTTFLGKVWEAIRGASGNLKLLGENRGQINILLLGIGGLGHEGPYLTDTMILAQFRLETSEISLVSIPRDLLAELPNNLGNRKINAVFAEGVARTKNFNEAGRWSQMAVERLSGLTIPYFAVIDFKGFEKAIDEVGGINIIIDRSFEDFSYPMKGKEAAENPSERYEHLRFQAGPRHLDGALALKFARSRHGNNNEGSDFARSLRQQKVMKAFKDKVLRLNLITNSDTISNLLDIFADNFHTNLTPGEIFRLYDLIKEKNIQTFLSLSLEPETGLLCPTLHETASYILIPCSGKTHLDIQNFFKNSFALGGLAQEKSVVWLGNSTKDPNLYKQAEQKIKHPGLTIWPLDYSKDNLTETVFFQANPKPKTSEFIKNMLNAREVSLPPPGVKVNPAKVDIIVILGKNKLN